MSKKQKSNREIMDEPRKVSSINIPVEEIAALFKCGRCHRVPTKPPVYTCRNSHSTCTQCYQRCNRDCSVCKEPLMGRNQVLEEVMCALPSQTCAALTEYREPLKESRSEQSLHLVVQDPNHLEKLEKARLEAEKVQAHSIYSPFSNNVTTSNRLGLRPSHRPVKCPYPCKRMVTYSGLYPHFELYHPQVLITIVHKDTVTEMDLHHKDVLGSESRCYNFLVVRLVGHLDDDDDDCCWSSAQLQRMMTRVGQESANPSCLMVTLSVGQLDNNDFIIWLGCLYESSPLLYTISVSSVLSQLTISFTGELVSLHQPQGPREVYDQNSVLRLSAAFLRQLKFEQTPLKITVIFHSEVQVPLNDVEAIDIPLWLRT